MIRAQARTQLLDRYTAASLGLVGDGVFDNSARLQAGIEYVADRGGGVIKLDVGSYRIDSIQTLLRDGVHIEGFAPDLTILDFSQRTSAYANQGSLLLSGDGGLSNIVSVTGDVLAGAVSIPVDDISGFAPGDRVVLRSTEVLWSEATIGEILTVQWADSGYVYLKVPVTYDYDTGSGTVELCKLTTHSGSIKNLTVKGRGPNPASYPSPTYTGTPSEAVPSVNRGDLGLEVRYGEGYLVENVKFIGTEYRCVTFAMSVDSTVRGSRLIFDEINQQSQYGVSTFGANLNVTVEGNFFYNGRHHVTTLTTSDLTNPQNRGLPVGILIANNQHTGSWLYPIDTHRGGSGVVVANNKIKSQNGGINCRTPNSKIIGNDIELPIPNTSIPGISGAHQIAVYYGMKNVSVIGNTGRGGSSGIMVFTPTTRGENIAIVGNNISETENQPIYIRDVDGFSISANVIGPARGAVSGIGHITVIDCKSGVVGNNSIAIENAIAKAGVRVTATNPGDATEIIVATNTIRKLGGAGAATGILFDNNVTYSTIGVNSTFSCDTPENLGTGTTNVTVNGSRYGGLKTIASGAISVSPSLSVVLVYTEGGASTDDLTDITDGADGQVLTLRGNDNSHVVTCKDGASNLRLAGDFVLSNSSSTITLICLANVWYEVARSMNGPSVNLGTISSGTLTPNPNAGPMQYYTNNGAHILSPGTAVGGYYLKITMGASAGTITLSGFTPAGIRGDSFTYTSGDKFSCYVTIDSDGDSVIDVVALQ